MDQITSGPGSSLAEEEHETPRPHRMVSLAAASHGMIWGAGAFAVFCVALTGWLWATDWRYVQTTNNAYVQGEITAIRPKVSGYVEALFVDDNQHVNKGDPLLRIEDDEIRQQIAGVEADLARFRAEGQALAERKHLQDLVIAQADAEVAIAEAERDRTAAELVRSQRLARAGNASKQALEIATAASSQALGGLTRANARLEAAKVEVAVLEAEDLQLRALVKKTEADLNILKIHLDDTLLRAPVSGVIGNRSVRVGQLVDPGRFLLAIVPLDDVWVVGNFKETQLTHVEIGQEVDIRIDTFPGERITGTVASVAPASGAEFSILPPQNATGNFTKIVQRIPVKIAIAGDDPMIGRLRPGMSSVVSIDTKGTPPSAGKLVQER